MKRYKRFLIGLFLMSFILNLTACGNVEQVVYEQENTTTPVSAWQDYYGNVYVNITNTKKINDDSAYIQVSYNNKEEWNYWTADNIIFPYSELESSNLINNEISIYSRLSSYNNNDGSILYNASENSTALKYKVKEVLDENAEVNKEAIDFGKTVNDLNEYLTVVPQNGTKVLCGWSYSYSGDDTIYYHGNIWYFNETKEKIFIKKLTITNEGYNLNDTTLIYEYTYTTRELLDDLNNTSTISQYEVFHTYNNDFGISVKNGDVIKIRVKETNEQCCSEIAILFPYDKF